jgi:hypothetical protein
MTQSLSQLLSLRKRREQQAETDLQRTFARYREQEARVSHLTQRQCELAMAVASRIATLYRNSVESRLGPGDLETLAASVEEQYRLETEMTTIVAAETAVLAAIGDEVTQARGVLREQTRAVQKLEQMLDEVERKAEQTAEIIAEAEAERPAAAQSAAFGTHHR